MTAAWVALLSLGYEMTGSSSGTGLVLILSSLPAIAANFPAGALADRVSKRNLLFAARVSTVVLLALFIAARRVNSLALFYTLVIAVGAAGSFLYVPFDALLQELFDPPLLQMVNARLQSVKSLSFFLGPVVGGGAMALGLRDGLFLLCASMMAVSSAPLLLLPRGERKRDGEKSGGGRESENGTALTARHPPRGRFARDIRMGFTYFKECPTCRFLLLFSALFFGVYCLTSGISMPYCEEILGRKGGMKGSVIYSTMDAAVGLSGFFGAFFISRLLKRFGQVGSLLLGAGLSAVELLVMGFVPDTPVVVGTLSITGISAPLLMVPMLTLVQRNVKPSYTGRVLNGIDAAVNAAALLSCGLGALLAERIGILRVFKISGFMLVALVLVLILLSDSRSVRIGADNQAVLHRFEAAHVPEGASGSASA
jgi:predicted MFS family arabinose efflux permease